MNKILESFLIKILLLILTSAFHFSVFAWEANESSCKEDDYGLPRSAQYRCSVDGSDCRGVNAGDACSSDRGVCQRVSNVVEDVREYDRRDRDCQDLKAEKKAERDRQRDRQEEEERRQRDAQEDAEQAQIDLAKEEMEKAEKARDQALEEQQEIIKSAKNECTSSYDQVIRERQNIESQVQSVQQQLDKIEDAITKHYSSISEGEDKVRESILQLTREERREMDSFKQGKIKAEQAEQAGERTLAEAIEEIEDALFESASALEEMADFKEQACSSRSMEYLRISVECYNEKLTQVTAEREELFKRIRTGRYEAANLNDLFQINSQNIDQTFQSRLNALHAHCFSERTGENLPHPGQSLTVQIPCDLTAFENRAEVCRKNNNNRQVCPVKPDVQAIEQKTLAQLKKVEKDRVKMEKIRKKATDKIKKLREEHEDSKVWMARGLADLEEKLKLAKKDFDERHKRAENELTRVRERAENSILQLERDKIRLLASDPARHFEEQMIVARASCCHSVSAQQTAQQCTLLSRYEQDATRFQFAFVRPLPSLRSASGPTSTATNNANERANGGVR